MHTPYGDNQQVRQIKFIIAKESIQQSICSFSSECIDGLDNSGLFAYAITYIFTRSCKKKPLELTGNVT